jgi:hypothetical protein
MSRKKSKASCWENEIPSSLKFIIGSSELLSLGIEKKCFQKKSIHKAHEKHPETAPTSRAINCFVIE